jgi:hypothetical protein
MLHDTYKIIWQKWHDPFGSDLEETKEIDYDNEIDELPHSQFTNSDDEEQILSKPKAIKVIASPMGLIPYNEHTASSKIFNFWLGHCNFDITNAVTKIIESTDGVEILDIFTRYRFRVAIGKCFGDSETMNRIQNNIYRYLDDQKRNTDFNNTI